MKKKLSMIAAEGVMLAVTVLFFLPLMIMVFGAFKDPAEAAMFSFRPPSSWHFENFSFVIKTGNVLRSFVNSVILTGFSAGLGVLFASMAAYIIARRKTGGAERLYNYFLIGMVAPVQIITTYVLLDFLGLKGTFAGLIMVYIGANLPFNILMFSSFIRNVPVELDEAAFLDGGSLGQVFFGVVLPLLKPIYATSFIIFAMSVWNDFQMPLYLLNTPKKWTLPLTVYNFYGQYYSNWNYVFADMMITALPIVVVYLFAQKYIVEGMTAGAIKG
jgi:raffinose/stachyose/melibiose transport system permease protein